MSFSKRLALVGSFASLSIPIAADAGTFTTLYSFTGGSQSSPASGLIYHDGYLYGTTGGNEGGTLFRIDPTTGAQTVVFNFSFSTGDFPATGFVSNKNTIYGVTSDGGANGAGAIYKFDLTRAKETVLYSFPASNDGAGETPGGLILEGETLYGTLSGDGPGYGVIYSFDLETGTEATVYSFGGGSAGWAPSAGLVYAGGTLYGTNQLGGTAGYGTIFAVDVATGSEAVLHDFQGGTSDGQLPIGGLVAANGNLYGATYFGFGLKGDGGVFAFNPATEAETSLHSWNDRKYKLRVFRGYTVDANLIYHGGALYGTTFDHGSAKVGTIFKINPNTGHATVLHTFTGSPDGAFPVGTLVYAHGSFYGTTSWGGTGTCGTEGKKQYGCGTVFKLTP